MRRMYWLIMQLVACQPAFGSLPVQFSRFRIHSFIEIGHEVFFYSHSVPTTDFSRGAVSFTGERMTTVYLLVNCVG